MNELNILQIILLTVWSGLAMLDGLSFNFGMNGVIQTGIFTGLVVNDVGLGLQVGGALQLFALGIGTYGGASIPNYTTAAMLVTALAGGMENAETLITSFGVPIAALTIQFDVLGRMTNTFFQQRADKYVLEGNFKKIELMNWLGTIPWALSRAIPVFIALILGPDIVKVINENIPTVLTQGFQVAGKMLPVVGFSILLKYLPAQRNFHFVILGFVLSAYLKLDVLAVSLIGLVAAVVIFKNKVEATANSANLGGDDYDE